MSAVARRRDFAPGPIRKPSVRPKKILRVLISASGSALNSRLLGQNAPGGTPAPFSKSRCRLPVNDAPVRVVALSERFVTALSCPVRVVALSQRFVTVLSCPRPAETLPMPCTIDSRRGCWRIPGKSRSALNPEDRCTSKNNCSNRRS